MNTFFQRVVSNVLDIKKASNQIRKQVFFQKHLLGMEKSLASLLILILVATSVTPAVWMTQVDAAVPVTIFEDDFNQDGTVLKNNWDAPGGSSALRKETQDDFVVGSTGLSGDKGLVFLGDNNSNPDDVAQRKISTMGYSDLTLSYSLSSKLIDEDSNFVILYSLDEGAWTTLQTVSLTDLIPHQTYTYNISNPARNARIDLRFEINGAKINGNNDLVAIDNVLITGEDAPIFYEGFEYGPEDLLVSGNWTTELVPKVKGYNTNDPNKYWSDDNNEELPVSVNNGNRNKGYSLILDGVKNSNGSEGDAIQKIIDTTGFEDVSVRYSRRVDKLNSVQNENYRAFYSINGGNTWISLETIVDVKQTMESVSFGPLSGTGNNPNFMLRFEINGSTGSDDSFLDDIIVWGDRFVDSEDASISGQKFNDVNGNGVKDDGENGLSGITINLSGIEYAATTTDENGNFTFTNLRLGTYKVCEVVPTGWNQTYPQVGTDCTTEESVGHEIILSESEVHTGVLFGNILQAPNNPPVFIGPTAVTGPVNQLISFILLVSDSDVGDTVILTYDLPEGAQYNEGTGGFTWTPVVTGTSTATFYAFDGEATTTHMVEIVVTSSGNGGGDPELCPDVTVVSDITNFVTEKEASAVLSWVHPGWTASIPTASWIWATVNTENPTTTEIYNFTKTFNITGTVTSATLNIAADNSYSARINNLLAGDDSSEMNFTSEGQDSFDVMSLIQSGENTLAITLTNMAMVDATPELNPAGLLYKLTVGIEAGTCDSGGNDNSLPTFAGASSATGIANQQVAFSVLASDADNDPLTLTQNLPSGAVYDSLTGNFTWTPTEATSTQAIFYAYDGTGTTTHTVSITINPENNGGGGGNSLPIFNGQQTATGSEDDELSFVVTVSDPDNDPLTLTQDLPAGAVYSTTTGQFAWTPTSAVVTNAVFYAYDGTGTTTHTVVITITADGGNGGGGGNSLPVFVGPTSVSGSEDDLLSFTVTVSDPNNDPLTLGQTLPVGAAYSTSTGAFTWTPADATSTQAIFTAYDGVGTSTHTVAITVSADQNNGGGNENNNGGGGGSVILPNNPNNPISTGGPETGTGLVLDVPQFNILNVTPEAPVIIANLIGNPGIQNPTNLGETLPVEVEGESETQVAAAAEALDNGQLANIFQILKDITWWIWAYIVAELLLLGIVLRGGLITRTENNMLALSGVAALLAGLGITIAAINGSAEDILSLSLTIPSLVWVLAVMGGSIGLLMKEGIRLPIINSFWKNIIAGLAGLIWIGLTAAQLFGNPVYGTISYLFMTMVALGYGIYAYFLAVK